MWDVALELFFLLFFLNTLFFLLNSSLLMSIEIFQWYILSVGLYNKIIKKKKKNIDLDLHTYGDEMGIDDSVDNLHGCLQQQIIDIGIHTT